MIILQKNHSGLPSNTTLLAEFIVEFFEGESIDRVFSLGGKSVQKALKLLVDLRLIEIVGDKIVLTREGKDFLSLPNSEGLDKLQEEYF